MAVFRSYLVALGKAPFWAPTGTENIRRNGQFLKSLKQLIRKFLLRLQSLVEYLFLIFPLKKERVQTYPILYLIPCP